MQQPEIAPRFQPIDRQQVVLEPVDVEELIAAEHPARNIWEFTSRLDLSAFHEGIAAVEGHAGRNAWDPRLLISVWIYAYSRGMSSAREIERQCGYEPGLRWLTGLQVINHHTLSDFRVRHGEALQQLFVQVLGVLTMEKLITLERVTVDGTKVRANVNKKTFSRAQKIREHLKLARKHVEELQQEEREQGRQAAARRRAARERVERLESALAEVERLQQTKKWEKQKDCHASVTDADAQFMRTSDHGLAPAYNVQITADAAHDLIANVEVSKQPSDAEHFAPAMDRTWADFGSYPGQALVDGDYTTRTSIVEASDRGIDLYGSWTDTTDNPVGHGIHPAFHPSRFQYDQRRNECVCPEGKRLPYHSIQHKPFLETFVFAARKQDCHGCASRPLCSPKNKMPKLGRTVSIRIEDPRVEQFKKKMATEPAQTVRRQRSRIAEFPHAWLKAKLNFVRFRCRGLHKVRAEAIWACLTYNLQRAFKLFHPLAA